MLEIGMEERIYYYHRLNSPVVVAGRRPKYVCIY